METVVVGRATTAGEADRLDEINRKLDALTGTMEKLGQQVNFLMDRAEAGRRRQQEIDDLFADLTPVVKEMYCVAEEQLEEMQDFVQLEDLLALVKRLARNTKNINEMLDLLESAQDFVKDAAPLTREMMDEATYQLSTLESKGYFAFTRQAMYIMDQIVTSFSEEDVRQLGDNVVLILNTVKQLTQPEVMGLVNALTQGFQAAEAEAQTGELDTSFLGLVRTMRDPEVKRGLAVTMATLKRVSHQAPYRQLASNGSH